MGGAALKLVLSSIWLRYQECLLVWTSAEAAYLELCCHLATVPAKLVLCRAFRHAIPDQIVV